MSKIGTEIGNSVNLIGDKFKNCTGVIIDCMPARNYNQNARYDIAVFDSNDKHITSIYTEYGEQFKA